MTELSKLEADLKLPFKNKDLLQQAFVHRSYLNENRDFHLQHNERLEFLGDAVLELIVTEHLYKEYPDNPEGDLTAWRAALVNTKMLSHIGRELEFSNYLMLSRGEAKEEGKARDYILANTVEAFIGASYLDQGLKNAEKFITTYILSKLPEVFASLCFGIFFPSIMPSVISILCTVSEGLAPTDIQYLTRSPFRFRCLVNGL